MTGGDSDGDPRLSGDRVRTVVPRGTSRTDVDAAQSAGTVTLVGVVHEHPASVHRVRTVVDRRDPAVLALELPPAAIRLYVDYAADDGTSPAYGGEMSAAIQAASTDRVVGIDGPSTAFLGRLAATLVRERPDRDAVRGILGGLAAATKEAAACAVVGAVASRTSIDLAVGRPVAHACGHHDDADTQAADEDRQIRRARAVMDAIAPSGAARYRDAVREAHMATRLESLRRGSDVVAVVGYGHLDAVAERLSGDVADAGS